MTCRLLSLPFLLLSLLISTTGLPQVFIPKFDIQGHRGARGMMPENSIPAFLLALDSGVTTLEMDVVITRDQQVIVSHEPWIAASICWDTTGIAIKEKSERKYNIFKMTYDQVVRFDCGSKGNERFPEQEKMKVAKPLLSDVIVAAENHIKNFSRYEVDYNIEVKSEKELDGKFQPNPGVFSDLVYQVIDQYLPWDRVVIQCFDFRVLKYWHEKYPQVRLAARVENLKTIDENLQDLGFTPSIYSPDYKLLSKDEIRHCHDLKMRVIPWTVNDVPEMIELKLWNVDGFITDYPNRATRLKRTLNLKVPNGNGRK
jgi:glycerophosphoryl diester phosphodiesterase